MATYETRAVGPKGETDIICRTGIALIPEGWQNMTPEQAATRPWLVGRISEDGSRYHVTSYAQQTFQHGDWKQNNAAYFGTFDEALGWIKAECNNVLERL